VAQAAFFIVAQATFKEFIVAQATSWTFAVA